jgi:iron complex outermembrane receptor protein
MRNIFLTTILLCLNGLVLLAQNTKTVEGTIKDGQNNPVIGTFIKYAGSTDILLSDEKGAFKIDVPNNVHQLSFDFFSCPEPITQTIPDNGKMKVTINCAVDLADVVIIGSAESRSITSSLYAVDRLNVKNLSLAGSFADINTALNNSLPSVQSNRQTVADGTDHIDPVAIRGLGPDQTLVLVNGKRYHKSALINVNGTPNRGTVGTDLSSIPFGAIDRIEVLRDGAAAQYGSDAIAGVVNIILKSNEPGLRFQVNSGMNLSSYPRNYYINRIQTSNKLYELNDNVSVYDGKYVRISGGYGFNIKGGVGNSNFVHISTDLGFREATNRTGTYTGSIYPLSGSQTDESILLSKNLTRRDFDMRIGNSAIDNYGVSINGEYSAWKDSKFYFTGIGGLKYGEAAGFYRYPSGYPSTVRAEVLRIYPDGFLPLIQTKIVDYSAIAGFRQKIGKQFEVDASFTTGTNTFDYLVKHSINYTQAKSTTPIPLDFDCGGLKFEQKVYNFTLSKSSGLSGDEARLAFFLGGEFRQEMFAIRPGDEASYRNYVNPDNVSVGAQVFQGFTPPKPGASNSVSRNNIAAFADVALTNLIPNLKLEGALRFEQYSDFRDKIIYKIGARYDLIQGDKLAFRGSYNTGFRAPSLHQIGYTKVNTLFISNPNGTQQSTQAGTYPNESDEAKAVGIEKLKAETSKNYAVGIVSRLNKELRLSIDAYRIDIDNRIILTNSFSSNSNKALADLLKPTGANTVNFFTNAINTRAMGVEGVLFYEKRWPALGQKYRFSAELSGSVFRNHVLDSIDVFGEGKHTPFINASSVLKSVGEVKNYFNREDESRFEVALPNTKVVGSISFETDIIALNLRSTYFGKVQYLDPSTAMPVNVITGKPETLDQTFSPKIVTDLSLQFKVSKLRLGFGCNNIFDVYPDVQNHSNIISDGRFIYSRRVHQMGLNGRSIFVNLVYFTKKQ